MIPPSKILKSSEFKIATSRHGGTEFISYVRRKNILGMQYHPEKSQLSGLQLINNFATIPHVEFN